VTPLPLVPTLPTRLRWYNSLFFRLVVLGGVLLLCLLGSVYVITTHYLGEAAEEMQISAERASQNIALLLSEDPAKDTAQLTKEIVDTVPGAEVVINPFTRTESMAMDTTSSMSDSSSHGTTFYVEQKGDVMTRVAHMPVTVGDREVMLTLRVPIYTGTEVLRAMKNKYMLVLTAIFILTLGMMIYVFAHSLRPLTELSETCAAITAGELRVVQTSRSSGEVRALEETFNKMVGALKDKEVMEAKLRQAQRLSALGNLAAGIAHDVRNPLNAIKLLSSHAIDTLDGGPDSSAAKPMHTIRKEVDRLEEIVSSFLSLARERELIAEPCQVDALLEECLRLFRREAESRGVRLLTELRAGNAELMLDAKHFTRAVLNVLMNALEACPPGGRVRLFSRRNERQIEVEIRDDGPGIAPEVLERMFEPYYTTKPGGTGLGLAITRGIIEEHSGTIEVSSTPGHGCQVLITFPLQSQRIV